MELKTFEDIKNNVCILRFHSGGPYGYATPLEKILPICRDILKAEVCDKLGLDVDEVIETMLKNQEYFENHMDEGTVLLYTYYVVNDKHIWFSDAQWFENKKEGSMYDTYISVNLRQILNIDFNYVSGKDINGPNVIEVPSGAGGRISHCRYSCKLDKTLENPDVYELMNIRDFKCHGTFHRLNNMFGKDIWTGVKAWKLYTEKEECEKHVNTVFSVDNDIKYKKAELTKQYKAAVRKYNSAKDILEKADKDVEELKKQYFELTGEQI